MTEMLESEHMGAYDMFFLMVMDAVPVKTGWLRPPAPPPEAQTPARSPEPPYHNQLVSLQIANPQRDTFILRKP